MDPRRNKCMAEEEEDAQKYFEEMKDELSSSFPHGWKDQFKACVDKYINQHLKQARCAMEMPLKDDEEESIRLHAMRQLVAGAFQEWELAQQHEHASMCAEIDCALVWQGRGYVILILLPLPHLKLSTQSSFKKVPPTLWLVMLMNRRDAKWLGSVRVLGEISTLLLQVINS